jgi:hypothetical protein
MMNAPAPAMDLPLQKRLKTMPLRQKICVHSSGRNFNFAKIE